MTDHDAATGSTRTVRFHDYGEPADVLRLETIPVPMPGPAVSGWPCRPAG